MPKKLRNINSWYRDLWFVLLLRPCLTLWCNALPISWSRRSWYTWHDNLYILHCCTLYTVLYYNVHCALEYYNVHYMLYIIHCNLCSVICTLYCLGTLYSLLFTVLVCLLLCILYSTLYKTLFTYSRPYRTRVLWTIHHPAAPLVLAKPANILSSTRDLQDLEVPFSWSLNLYFKQQCSTTKDWISCII